MSNHITKLVSVTFVVVITNSMLISFTAFY